MTADPARDISGGGYLWRSLTPRQIEAIRAARAKGVSARDLAAEYGVSRRTIYRALRYAVPFVVVQVGDWKAEFVISESGPIRCTAWWAA